VEGAAGTASGGEEIKDDERVAGGEQGVGEVLRGLDLPHVGLDPLLPPPHGLANHQVHLWKQKKKMNEERELRGKIWREKKTPVQLARLWGSETTA
jgi:hypothetical protein